MNVLNTDALRAIVREEMAWSGVPGVTAALVRGDSTEYICEGLRDREAGLPVTQKTLFIIGSCSKSMTTAMLGRLVDEGILDWDTPVCRYAPDLHMADPVADAQMTLRDMCLHRTGLANHDGAWPDPEGRAVMAKRLRFLQPNLRFREKKQYNNVIYALTAYVAECATGKRYDALMREYIFEPLGMKDTVCAYRDYLNNSDAAQPYCYSTREGRIIPQEKWDMDSAVAAASIATTAEDMAKWLRFNISGGFAPDGRRLLSQAGWDNIHRGGIEGTATAPRDFVTYNGYGFGWWEGSYRGHAVYMHKGKINGFSSLEVFMPEMNAGVFASLNLQFPESHLYERLAYTAFDQWLGLPDAGADWKDAYHGAEPCTPELWALHERNDMPGRSETPAEPALPLSAYCGIYEDAGYGRLTIEMRDGALTATHNIYRCPLTPYDGEIFQADDFWEDVYSHRMPFTFTTEKGGKQPSAVVLPIEKQVAPVTFKRVK